MGKTDLSLYNNDWYKGKIGAGALKRTVWYFTNHVFFSNSFFPFNALKVGLLRLFGARVGRGVVVKPNVNIKYPWLLNILDYSWIGEGVWIDNLATVVIGKNVCISQGAMLLTGNHDFSKPSFDLMVKGITLEDGCWIGAKAVVCPGVVCGSHSVLTVMSVATKDLEPYMIYTGNPASLQKQRVIVIG